MGAGIHCIFIAPTMLEGTNSYRSNFLQCDLEQERESFLMPIVLYIYIYGLDGKVSKQVND